MTHKRRRKEPEYDPVIRKEPEKFPAEFVEKGIQAVKIMRENNDVWNDIVFASIDAINQQSIFEDLQSLTLEERIALQLMQRRHLEQLGIHWAVSFAAVLTELLPRYGLADDFIEVLQRSDFRKKALDLYETWYLPENDDGTR